MSITTVSLHHTDGRIRGSFVYMLLCSDGGPIYVKVGMSDKPTQRAQQLLTNVPVRPDTFAVCEVPGRRVARALEGSLLREFEPWEAQGEWFKLTRDDRPAFNAAWRRAFARHQRAGWPLTWTQVPASTIRAAAARRSRAWSEQYRNRGEAFRDFVADSRVDADPKGA